MTDKLIFVDTVVGRALLARALQGLQGAGMVEGSIENPTSTSAFTMAAREISIPSDAIARPSSAEFQTAKADLDGLVGVFRAILGPVLPGAGGGSSAAAPAPAAGGRLSLRMDGGQGSAHISFLGNGPSMASAGAEDEMEDAEAPAGAAGAKRTRLGMSDADLARACTAVNLPVAQPTPQFLVDKPLDVRMYTPLLIELYSSIRKVNEGVGRLAAEVFQFEGEFLELSATAVGALPTTPLVAALDTSHGSRFFHRLDQLREAGTNMLNMH